MEGVPKKEDGDIGEIGERCGFESLHAVLDYIYGSLE